ncbi:MAG: PEGA domain-containing protein [Bacteroidetes bacterium]|nr:PEGA domain-containing protein [Bacteroidota bacterium]
MKSKLFTLVIASTFLMASCATIFTGTKDAIRFDSNPQGASVYIDGLEVCKTPCTTQVKRSLSDKLAEIKLDGYETRVITLDRKFNAVSIINLGSLIGWGIDAATGSLMKYDRKGYEIELEKNNKTSLLTNPSKIEINTDTKIVDVYVTQK